MTIDELIDQAETIIRARSAVRTTVENIARATKELATHRDELTRLETAFAEAVGGDAAKDHAARTAEAPGAWHSMELKHPGGWTIADKTTHPITEHPKFDRPIRKGDIVWMTRRRELGTVIRVKKNGDHIIDASGKDYRYTARNLRMPLPGEAEAAHIW